MVELEVRHLRYLDAIAGAGSLTRAAAELGLSQPALTAQVRRVEGWLGGAVFVRGRHGARPTELGEVVLGHTRTVLAALDSLDAALRRFHDGQEVGVLRIGTFPTALAERLCDVVGEVAAGRAVDLVAVDGRAAALAALADGSAELVLHVDYPGRELVPPAGVRLTPVGPDPLFVAVPPEHPAASVGEVDLADLRDASWLLSVSGDDEFDRLLMERCAEVGIGPITVRAMEPVVLRQTMRRDPKAIMVLQALDTGLGIPGVVVALRGTPLRCRHVLLWRDDCALGESGVDAVRDGLIAAYAELAATGHRKPEWLADSSGWLGNF